MENLLFSVRIIAPVFLIIALGFVIKKIGLISDRFVAHTSDFVFKISLPALIFVKLSQIPVGEVFSIKEIGFAYGMIFFFYFVVWFFVYQLSDDGKDRGVIIQGAYRSNFAIVGLALIGNMYGESAVGHASLLLAFVMPLYNVLAVIALSVSLNLEKRISWPSILADIFKNPLIIAIIITIPFSYWHWNPGEVVMKTANYLAMMALPLALIGIGASLNFKDLYRASGKAYVTSVLKIIIFPLLAMVAAINFGFEGEELGILFILFASPTAIVSYIMAQSMGANSRLAGNIIVITTMGSVLTISGGIVVLRFLNLI